MGKRILQFWQFSLLITLVVATAGSSDTSPRKRTIVFLGDSITAGLGVESSEAYPSLIEKKIEDLGLPYQVENAGVSGETSAGGLRHIDWLLQRPISVLVLELGANDGLRGLSPTVTQANLQAIIDKARMRNSTTKIVIAGMRMPPNLGGEFAAQFQTVFADLADRNHAVLIPFLLDGVGGHQDLNQGDQIHPNAAGHKIIAETVWQKLKPLLGLE